MTRSVYVKKRKGYITLMTVLVISAIGLAIGTALLFTGAGSVSTSLTIQKSNHAINYANSCSEEALIQISNDSFYEGTGSMNFSTGSCTYTVTHQAQSETVDAVGVEGSTTRRIRVTLDINGLLWQEIP